ncbi:Hypothetical protein A7982_01574 [Minicystis rosea]|nr:Hypothetical protein A7982_01574 [Minicystis rosea]
MKNVLSLAMGGLVLTVTACNAAEESGEARSELARFESMTVSQAQAAYRDLDRAQQIELWDEQLTRHLASGRLSPAQASAVRDLRDHLGEAIGPSVDAYEARLRAVMTEKEMRRIVGRLGDRRVVAQVEAPALLSGSEHVAEAPQAMAPGNCNDRWDCDNTCSCTVSYEFGYYCHKLTCTSNCTTTSSGCGFLWTQSCTGMGTETYPSSCDNP